MIPILFDKTETTFTSNGIGRLSDAISCIVTEERNGQYELKMVYPITGVHYAELTHSRIIFAKPAEDTDNQAFRIYKITKPSNGKVTVLAQHISYQLTSIIASPFTADNAADAVYGLISNASSACPFTIDTDIQTPSPFVLASPESIRSAVGGMEGSILDIYGGELEWDMYDVHLHQNRGQNRGKIVNYGKNIINLQQEESIDKVITGIYPYYKSDEYVELSEKILTIQTTETYPYQRIQSLDLTKYFTDTPTEAELRARAQEYLTKNTLGIPRLTIKASFIDDENHVPVKLCDTVTVYYAPLGVTVQAKVVRLEYNVLLGRYETMTVGSIQDSITDAIITTEKAAKSSGKENERTANQIAEVKSQVAVISAEVQRISGSVMANYILPFGIRLDEIRDIDQGGELVNVLQFHFESDSEGNTATFYAELGFNVHTFEKNDNFQDAVVTIKYLYDNQVIQSFVQYWRDGRHLLMINAILGDITEGQHNFWVQMQVQGASLY